MFRDFRRFGNFAVAFEHGLLVSIRPTPSYPPRDFFASVHKYLRPCDLCKEPAFDTPTRKW